MIRLFSRRFPIQQQKQHVFKSIINCQQQRKWSSFSASETQVRVERILEDFRKKGHMYGSVNSLVETPQMPVNLHGLKETDTIDRSIGDWAKWCKRDGSGDSFTVGQLIKHLHETYCSTLSIEFDHLSDEEKSWLAKSMEQTPLSNFASPESQIRYAKLLSESQEFDQYIHRKLRFVKRYGLEGAESLLVAMDSIFQQCCEEQVEDVVIGMPHRGRNNFLAILLQYPAASMFAKMRGKSLLPPGVLGTDDVLSHIAQSIDLDENYGAPLHVSLLHNPSHLEAINPVALGKTRARQDEKRLTGEKGTRRRGASLCVLMHGDSAAAGQGVVAESALLARLPGFTTGGSLHIIVNNQLGFTTLGEEARSSRYASDVAKINGSPVLRVNGEDPIAVARAASLAVRFRRNFGGDVWLDIVCYRRHGHNELDDPSFTQPTLYANIARRVPVADAFSEKLSETGVWALSDRREHLKKFSDSLDEQMNLVDKKEFKPHTSFLQGKWSQFKQGTIELMNAVVNTGVEEKDLRDVANASVALPDGVSVHKRLQKGFIDARKKRFENEIDDVNIDWATAEALAFGSLMKSGISVRLSGQDVQRGTFSHRHVVLTDQATGERFCPLNINIADKNKKAGRLEAINSPLSEFGVMGFEYGYSVQRSDTLTLWEAQFGDFANTAQVIIDQFIASGEHKWLRQSGLVLLLPHGYDGAGPEHSSCRIERYLQLSNDPFDHTSKNNTDEMPNLCIINPTTPANYFHALRRQIVWPFRKPLIVVAPKALIRLAECQSPLRAFEETFEAVLSDAPAHDSVTDVLLCSGKIYFELVKQREKRGVNETTALIRLEQLAPFPFANVQETLKQFPNAKRFRWVQEEPQNQGAWSFVEARSKALLADNQHLEYVGSGPMAASATGVHEQHVKMQAELFEQAFA